MAEVEGYQKARGRNEQYTLEQVDPELWKFHMVGVDTRVTRYLINQEAKTIQDLFNAMFGDKTDRVVCLSCQDNEQYDSLRLPLSGSLRVCPKCGESGFEIWKGGQ